ncbi:hypothetical protein ACFWYW_46465 [Nonomuraea sp. NPDC059023]|uniref:hypothetical protein n=1 Tax=unclassified Nonomuraea TaxID=2593643 RepID=UPI00368092D6
MAAVTPEQVAIHAGLPLPVAEEDLPIVEEALADAYRAVAAHLNCAPTPVTVTQAGVPAGRTWQLDQGPVIVILSAVPETDPGSGRPTGLFTITYRVGRDPDADPAYGLALARYVAAAAANSRLVRRLADRYGVARTKKSVSVEGQSVTYDDAEASPGSAAAGALPTLESLDGWHYHAISQRPGIGPHPAQTGAAWLL